MIKLRKIGREMLFKTLKDSLLKEIREQRLAPGTPILSTIQMSEKYNVSFVTANRAINELVKDGVLRRKRGSGTYVADHGGEAEEIAAGLKLYLNGLDYEKVRTTIPHSWFVYERLQKGMINAYPGPVNIESAEEILRRAEQGERFCSILVAPALSDLAALDSWKIPYVVVDYGDHMMLANNSVRKESVFGVYALMSYLMGTLGHRRVGYIGGLKDSYHADRYAMYETALRAFGLPFDESLVVRGFAGSEGDGAEGMRRLLALAEPPTAVFGDTDVLALGAVGAAREAGLDVPGDISVAGFDDIPGLQNFTPPLTTVNVPQDEMGRAAVEMLLERVRTGGDAESRVIHSKLVIRESCAHAKKK